MTYTKAEPIKRYRKSKQVMCEDLISRAEAIEALGEEPPVWCDEDYEIAERDQWREDVEAIKSVPSADRPRGEWIVHNIVCREEICLPYECPNCGFRYSRRFNFCSNCGADMRPTERSEE